jgi:hypothetical protein
MRRWTREKSGDDQRIRVLSKEAEARSVPSFENFTQETARSWPLRVRMCLYGLYGGVCCDPLLAITKSQVKVPMEDVEAATCLLI